MVQNEARQDLDGQKMRDIGRVLGFFSAYSELQTGMATYHPEYDVASLCDPKSLRDPKLLKRPKEYPDPHAFYLKKNDCHALYTEGWNQGHTPLSPTENMFERRRRVNIRQWKNAGRLWYDESASNGRAEELQLQIAASIPN